MHCAECDQAKTTDEMATHRVCRECADDLTVEIDGTPLRWTDKNGIVHAAVGSRMVASDPGTFILWTACERHDVPANSAVKSRQEVTCQHCK